MPPLFQQAPQAPRPLLPPQVDGTNDLPFPEAGLPEQPQVLGPSAASPSPVAPPIPPPAALAAAPAPTESTQLAAQLAKLNAPPTTKETLLDAVAKFAPTAISAAFGGLPAAAGAAQGVNAGLTQMQGEKDRQSQSLLAQVEAARGREQQAGEFGQTLQEKRDAMQQQGAESAAKLAEDVRSHNDAAQKPSVVGRSLVTPQGTPLYTDPAEVKQEENTHVLPDGTVIAVHNDPKSGKSSAEVLYQGKPAEKPGHVIVREVGGKLHNILIDAENGKDRADLGETRQPSAGANDHGVTMIGKDGKVYRLEPGQSVPEGAQTPAGLSSVNTPTTQQRNVAAQAALVHERTPYMLSELDRLKGKLGPVSGRLNEIMQGKLGLNDPDFAGLGADLLMYSSAVALMHARGRLPENLRAEFQKAIDNPGQDAGNLKAVITKIDGWAVKNPGVNPDSNSLPGGITLDDINAEIERRKKKP